MAEKNNPPANEPDDPAAPSQQDPGLEPEAQAVADTAGGSASRSFGSENGSSSYAPSHYDLQDDLAEADWLERTRQWVEENPVLAVAAAAGIGLVVGRLVMALVPEPEPPTFAERVGRRAQQFRKDAEGYADDAGAALSKQLARAAEALSDAAETAASKAETGYHRTKDLAEVVADAVADAVAVKTDSWLKKMKR
ncbi:MAG TPA: hypothetical protein VD962_04295 [Rubricoccaceae bacterium]|nr:hypothetical protein [Rubricoccaceae bacterium]